MVEGNYRVINKYKGKVRDKLGISQGKDLEKSGIRQGKLGKDRGKTGKVREKIAMSWG